LYGKTSVFQEPTFTFFRTEKDAKFKESASQHKLGLKSDESPGALENHKPRARDRHNLYSAAPTEHWKSEQQQ
jgi:hypothetical protein